MSYWRKQGAFKTITGPGRFIVQLFVWKDEIVRAAYALFSMGAPTLLPHSVHEPS
jgi:hypothetical protein